MGVFEDETARAIEYRRKMRAREANRLTAEVAMRGSHDALMSLRVKTWPLKRWSGWDVEERLKPER